MSDKPFDDHKAGCPHNALRKMKMHNYPFSAFICGNCSRVFMVQAYEPPEPTKEPMFDGREPWGLRDRQA